MIAPGQPAPDFSLASCDSEAVSLADYAGRSLVLYFYPKDDTPGCTNEAKDFRDRLAAFEAAGCAVVGVSPDSVKRHCNFRDKHGLNFALLADPEKVMLEAYGVWQEKKNYGKTYMGVVRSTVLVDSNGLVKQVWEKVRVRRKKKVDGVQTELFHADDVLAAAKELAGV